MKLKKKALTSWSLLMASSLCFVLICSLLLTGAKSRGPTMNPTGDSLYEIPLKDISGKATSLSVYRGQVLLVVNTASQCGYTPQYAGLQKLHDRFKARGFQVLGFPSNDFGGQEPGTDAEIRFFCESRYQVSFPLFAKGSVGGGEIQPLFRKLIDLSPSHSSIAWNFEKFLVSRAGIPIGRFSSSTAPEDPKLVQAIETALREPAASAGQHP